MILIIVVIVPIIPFDFDLIIIVIIILKIIVAIIILMINLRRPTAAPSHSAEPGARARSGEGIVNFPSSASELCRCREDHIIYEYDDDQKIIMMMKL